MAAQHPLHYLAQVAGTEIRAYKANKVVLLKMADEQSTTVCCRPAESQDLIIRDFQSGEIKFCISGAEIIDHLITVYYTPNDRIGTIKNNKMSECSTRKKFKVTNQQGVFNIENSSINTVEEKLVISFDVNSTVEEKALIIAFAIHLALTKRSGKLKKTLDVDIANVDVVDFTSTAYQCLPNRNKTIDDEVFSATSSNQQYHLIEIAQLISHDSVLAFLDDSPRHNVVLYVYHRRNNKMFFVIDLKGNLMYFARNLKEGELLIKQDSLVIGNISNFKQGQNALLTTIEQSITTNFTVQPLLHGKMNRQIIGSNGELLVQFNNDYPPVLSGTMIAPLTEYQKKVVFGYWFLLYTIVCPFARKSTIALLSTLKCDCQKCTPPLHHKRPSDLKCDQLFNLISRYQEIYINPVGHNSSQNIIYFCASAKDMTPKLTFECTPLQNMFGMVRLVVKERYGLPGFYAISLPPANNVAVYNREEKLRAYEEGNKIYDVNDRVIMELVKDSVTAGNSSLFTGYKLIEPRSRQEILQINIHRPSSVVHIIRQKTSGRSDHTFLQSAIAMSLAVKLFWSTHPVGSVITPEISYRYSSWTKGAKILQLLKPRNLKL